MTRLRDIGKAGYYLQRWVINRSRSLLRRRAVADRIPLFPAPDMPRRGRGAGRVRTARGSGTSFT